MKRAIFFVGLHKPFHAQFLPRCMLSVNTLLTRRGDFAVQDWIMDSGAFSRLASGQGHLPLATYAAQVHRWATCGRLLAAVAQDWMCESFLLAQTGLTIAEHQARTLQNYRELAPLLSPVYCLPVVQGYAPDDYRRHLEAYGSLLRMGQWVGIGSVCKRNAHVSEVERVLLAIHQERPDLQLHGFGLKRTALTSDLVHALLYSCDSMAWSYAARREGRNANSVGEALRYQRGIETMPVQLSWWQAWAKGGDSHRNGLQAV